MSVAAGQNAALMLDEFPLTGFAKSASANAQVAMGDATVFGKTSHVKVPLLRDGSITSDLFYDDTVSSGSWDVLTARYGSNTPGIVTFGPHGFALGKTLAMLSAYQANFSPKQIIDQLTMLTFTADAAANAVDFGVSLHALAAETSLPFTGTAVDNSASSANGGVGVIHVSAIAGAAPNAVVKIQHSTNNSTWVDLITFTAVTAATKERIEVAGTVNRYLRITITEGGTTSSVTPLVGFARR